MPDDEASEIPTRRRLTGWLALALCHVPPNLCTLRGEIPPPWVKDARAECARVGIRFVGPGEKARRAKRKGD